MKKSVFLTAVLAFAMTAGIGTAHAQQVGIDAAIRRVAEELSAVIGSGAGVAVLSMQTGSARMSDYLIDETIGALTWQQGGRGFTTMSRAQFDQGMGGLHINMAGPVDNTTVQTVGRLLGVRYIVTGTFEPLADFFRLRVQLIEAETAAIRSMYTADVQNDSLVAYLMGGARPAAAHAPAAGLPAQTMEVRYFTMAQRWATWFLNGIPGLGSFIIMGDTFGGMFQVICAGLGFTMMIGSVSFWAREEWVSWGRGGEYVRTTNTALWGIGWALIGTWQVFNIIRSLTFGENAPTANMSAAPISSPWNLAFVSGKSGIEGVTLSHTRRF